MTITKEKVIETLEAALANPNYLADQSQDDATNWFCSSVYQVLRKNHDVNETEEIQDEICSLYIYPSINECLFLKSYLEQNDLIEYGTWYYDPEYKIAARTHWATLIQSLKDSEQ